MSPAPDESPARDQVFVVPAGRLLPPCCPACGAPGTHPHALSLPRAHQSAEEEALQIYLCDLCFEAHTRHHTARLAWLLGAALLGAALATALSFYWGERQLLLQLLLLGVWCVLWVRGSRALSPRAIPVTEVGPPLADERRIHTTSSRFARALREAGLTPLTDAVSKPQARGFHPLAPTFNQLPWLLIAPTLVSFAWWGALHFLAQASIRVVNMGPGPVVLTIDDRRTLTLPAMRFERAELGQRVHVVAGARTLKLTTMAGEVVFEQQVRVLPSETTLLPRLLPQFCIYEEQKDYSTPNQPSRYTKLGKSLEPLLLTAPIDAWFSPLDESSSTAQLRSPTDPVNWLSTQGKRSAVRLLSCP